MNSRYNEKRVANLLMKTSSSMPNLFSKKNLNLADFGVFSGYIDKQLSFYNLDPKELIATKSIFNKTGIKFEENEKLCLLTTKAKNSLFGLKRFKDGDTFKEYNNSLYSRTFMSISDKNNFYDNPLHCYNILRKNNSIANDIVKKIFSDSKLFSKPR